MLTSWRASSRTRWVIVATTIALLYATIGVARAWADDDDVSPVVQVEEDWELTIADPDAGNAAPQITCTLSPSSHLDNLHCVVEINHQTVPYFAAGGFHLQTWCGEHNLQRRNTQSSASLSTSGEVIRWTSRMQVQNNALTFSIQNGDSTTWGTFGGTTLLATYGTSLRNLHGYAPETSVENSGVGFANNRVQSLVLKRVRYTRLDGEVETDDAPRVVHQSSAQLEPEP